MRHTPGPWKHRDDVRCQACRHIYRMDIRRDRTPCPACMVRNGLIDEANSQITAIAKAEGK